MMSTAILMAMGAEQSSKRPLAHDMDKIEAQTFAQTLDAQTHDAPVEIVPATIEKEPPVVPPAASSNGKTELAAENLANARGLAAAGKVKLFAGQAQGLVNSAAINSGKTQPSQIVTSAGIQVQTETECTETQVVEPSVNKEENSAATPAVPLEEPAANLQAEKVMPLEQELDKNHIQVSSILTPMVPREAAAAGETLEAAAEKKAAKEEGSAGPKTVAAKSGAGATHPTTDEAKLMQVVAQAPAPNLGQTTATHSVIGVSVSTASFIASIASAAPAVPDGHAGPVASSNSLFYTESGKNGADSGVASVDGPASAEGPVAAANRSGSKIALHGATAFGPDRETLPAAEGDPTSPVRTDVKEERTQAIAANAGSDIDNRTPAAGDVPLAAVHTLVTGVEVTTPIVSGLAKLPGGQGSVPAGALANGLKELDNSGAVARSMEAMERMPRTLSASPTALEVGIPDGTHGWLKVRAEMADGGVVNASVSAASSASQEMLHRELPSLTAYLQSEKVAVNTVVVHPAANAESRGYLAGPESGGSGQMPRESNQGGQQQGSVKAAAEVAEDVTGYHSLHGVDEDVTLPLATYGRGGGWLSVRA